MIYTIAWILYKIMFDNRMVSLFLDSRFRGNDKLRRELFYQSQGYISIDVAKKTAFTLLSFFLFLYGNCAFSTDLISTADALSEKGQYNEAITEYKRFIFFHADSEKADLAFFKMGLAYRATRNWHQALDTIEMSIAMADDPQVAEERSFYLVTTMLASGDYSLAKLELIKLIESARSEQIHQKALYFSGIASVYSFNWNATERYFGDFYSESDMENHTERLNSILSKTRNSYKSPRTAKLLSVFVPGAGQFYARNWRDGLNAFILNGLLIGLTASEVYKGNYDNASLIFLLLTSRYYMGNIYHAGRDAELYNENLDHHTAESILRYVSSDEP